jgi:hypothetical protein
MEDAYKSLSKETRKEIGLDLDGFLQRARNAVAANQAVLLETIDPHGGIYPGPGLPDARRGPPEGYEIEEKNISKVRSTLKQFVRDWADEGAEERSVAYDPLLVALQKYLDPKARRPDGNKWRVLCPGSGLGRLPYDAACLGYAAQGNEFSYHMLLGSSFILNKCPQPYSRKIYPSILSWEGRAATEDSFTEVRFPNIDLLGTLPADSEFSMAAGEFVEVYYRQVEHWDALLTSFFIDTAKNILLYIRTFAAIIRPGGFWANVGPLLWHFADVEEDMSIELSWEDVRAHISKYFDIQEEEWMSGRYASTVVVGEKVNYDCIFFSAVRNNVPPEGRSNSVYTD